MVRASGSRCSIIQLSSFFIGWVITYCTHQSLILWSMTAIPPQITHHRTGVSHHMRYMRDLSVQTSPTLYPARECIKALISVCVLWACVCIRARACVCPCRCCNTLLNIKHTLCSFHNGLYFFFHADRYFNISPTVLCMSCCTIAAFSTTSGCMLMSEKKVNVTGSSCPDTCCGGASIQEPFFQRGNNLVLWEWENWNVHTTCTYWPFHYISHCLHHQLA